MRKYCLISLCFLLLCTGYGLASDWVRFDPPEDSRSNPPVIAFEPDGTLWMAWPSYQQGRFRLAVTCRSQNKWSSLQYPDSGSADQVEPQLLIDPAKNPVLVYSSYDGHRWIVKRTARTPQGWDKPRIVGQGIHPTAVMVDGRLWIAWEWEGQIYVDTNVGPDDTETIRVIKPEQSRISYSSPCLAAGSGGEIWIAWAAARLNYQSVLVQRIDGKDHPVLVVDDGAGINRHPRMSVDRIGRAWIVYEGLRHRLDDDTKSWEQAGRPVYQMDKLYGVENPARVLRITDGKQWWAVDAPKDPAMGLMPVVFCSSSGPVWVSSRSFTGYSGPSNFFSPLCESLDAGGWINHGNAWLKGQSYKAFLSMTEDPEGKVWTAWAQHDRKKIGTQDTPSWTHMDGPDFIAVAPMPELNTGGVPRLVPFTKQTSEPPDQEALPRFRSTYQGETLQVFFGDLHQHSEISGCGRRNGRVDQNQHYTRFVRGLDFMCTIDHAEHQNDHTWHMTQMAAGMHNRPGEFVTFSGFEWTSEFDGGGNLYRGHYNAVFRDVGKGDYYFSASDPRYNTPLELWDALKACVGGAENVLTFAHHTSRRMAWLTWNYYDPDMAPLIEIAQARGSYEYEGCFTGLELDNDCTRVRGHYIRDGLNRGMRWGFVASGDHGGRQLVAVFAPRLDRDTIFDSLRNKRAYATSGERIFLDVRVNGRFMGEEFFVRKKSRKVEMKAVGTAPIVEVDVIRNGRSVRKWVPKNKNVDLVWEDNEPLTCRENYYYVRVIQADGGQAWSSPVWVIDPGIEGEFRFQVGGDELRVVYPDQESDFAVLMHNGKETSVEGTVLLDVPEGWKVEEKQGISVVCPPGDWQHAVFHVKIPSSALTQLGLPSVKARFVSDNIPSIESPLFVVGSPFPLSREQKAVLIDARTEISEQKFQEYIEKVEKIWREEI
jgi:hypothetical protein